VRRVRNAKGQFLLAHLPILPLPTPRRVSAADAPAAFPTSTASYGQLRPDLNMRSYLRREFDYAIDIDTVARRRMFAVPRTGGQGPTAPPVTPSGWSPTREISRSPSGKSCTGPSSSPRRNKLDGVKVGSEISSRNARSDAFDSLLAHVPRKSPRHRG
jgi:hypothetical protein